MKKWAGNLQTHDFSSQFGFLWGIGSGRLVALVGRSELQIKLLKSLTISLAAWQLFALQFLEIQRQISAPKIIGFQLNQ